MSFMCERNSRYLVLTFIRSEGEWLSLAPAGLIILFLVSGAGVVCWFLCPLMEQSLPLAVPVRPN